MAGETKEIDYPRVRESTVKVKTVVKLIRDKRANMNPAYKGEPYSVGRCTDAYTHRGLLARKLIEEAVEIGEAMNDPEEYADLLQAMQDLAILNGVDWNRVEAVRVEKAADTGTFLGGFYLYRGFGK